MTQVSLLPADTSLDSAPANLIIEATKGDRWTIVAMTSTTRNRVDSRDGDYFA